jgi:hypothetical protein
MAGRKKLETPVPTRAEVYADGRERIASLISFLYAAPADSSLPLTDEDRARMRRLREHASKMLDFFNAGGRK